MNTHKIASRLPFTVVPRFVDEGWIDLAWKGPTTALFTEGTLPDN